jgi:hypothetical protein
MGGTPAKDAVRIIRLHARVALVMCPQRDAHGGLS